MKKLLSLCLLAAVLVLAVGCDSSGPTGSDEAVIPSETKVLDDSSASKLTSVSDDLQTLTFTGDEEKIESIEEGDVIVSEPREKIPNGLLRKVSSVQRSGNTTTLATEQAALTEAIERGKFDVEGELTPSDVRNQNAKLEGISFSRPAEKQQAPKDQFFVEVDNVVLFDEDGDTNTPGDQITADGSVEFEIDYEFSADIEGFGLEQLRFVPTINTDTELDLEAEYALQEQKEKTIATYNFSPIVVPVPGSPLPVVLVPQLDVTLGIEGEVSAGIETGFDYQTEITSGLEYMNGSWSAIRDLSNSAGNDPIQASAETDAKLYADQPLTFKVYGVAGPYASPRAFLNAEVDLAEDPWWKLRWGVEAGVGVTLEALGRNIADYEKPALIGYEDLLAQADGPYDPDIPDEGLAAHYPLDGNTDDESENTNDGSITDNVSFIGGVQEEAAKFGGFGDRGYVTVPNNPSLTFDGQASFSMWVRIDGSYGQTGADCSGDGTDNATQVLLAKSGDRIGFVLMSKVNQNGKVRVRSKISDASISNESIAGTAATTDVGEGEWFHLTHLLDQTGTHIYVNGEPVAQDDRPADFSVSNDEDMIMGLQRGKGSCLDYWWPLDGALDEVRVYNRSLTEEEILALYNE